MKHIGETNSTFQRSFYVLNFISPCLTLTKRATLTEIGFYGGVTEIGGNKILISSRDGSIFLDFGLNMKRKREFSVGYGYERVSRVLGKYLLLEILPRIKGIYRKDLLKAGDILKDVTEINLQACLISHAHLDHYGLLGFLKPEIPIAMSRTTAALIRHSIETGHLIGPEGDIFTYRDRFIQEKIRIETDHKKKRELKEALTIDRPITIFSAGKKISGVPFDIEPYPVDHSVPAFGFLINTKDAQIAYTGDLRLHGVVKQYTEEFIENAHGVDYLIIEGTRITDSTCMTESKVKEYALRELRDKKEKFAAVIISGLDIDRLRTMIEVAKELKRIPVLSPRLAHLTKTLKENKTHLQSIPEPGKDFLIYYEKRSLIDDGYVLESQSYHPWQRQIYQEYENYTIKPEEIERKQGDYLMIFTGLSYITELIDIKPEPGSLFIESTSEPFDEEQEIEWEKVERWISLLRMDKVHIHSSGHANREDLLQIIQLIKPKTIIPIHTENPKEFRKLLKNENYRVILPEEGAIAKL